LAALEPLVGKWRPLPDPPGRIAVPPPLRAISLAATAERHNGLLAVVPGERDAEQLVDDVALFTDHVVLLPAWETLPFEHVSPSTATMTARCVARHRLSQGEPGLIVVGSVRAVTQRLSPSACGPVVVAVGDEVDRAALEEALAAAGYGRTDRVESRGEFAVRGSIVDVFGAQADDPVRVDFFGDIVEEVRTFSPESQRSSAAVDRLVAYPARELRPDTAVQARAAELLETEPWAAAAWDRIAQGVSFAGIESWLPWLAPAVSVLSRAAVPVVVFDPVRAQDRGRELTKEEAELAAALASTWGSGAPEAGAHPALYLDFELPPAVEAPPAPASPGDAAIAVSGLDAVPGDAVSLAAALTRLRSEGVEVIIAMDGEPAADRAGKLLEEAGFSLPRLSQLERPQSAIIGSGIHLGFVTEGLAVLGEREIAGRRRAHRRVRTRGADSGASYNDLRAGDYVVHHHHGIGRYEGLTTQTVAGIERDYLIVAYSGHDRLYVPTDQLAAVRRYSGGEAPRLSRMGGSDWSNTRGRVKEELAAVAERVVRLHRERAAAVGVAYPPDTPFQQEFEAAFPFEETRDQLTAIDDVKVDLEAAQPMDRLIFGDVGFGKTEVAMRAAFKVVQQGKQVAVLVPTTLLAQQHFETFSERFGRFGARVEALSRFLTPRQQKEVIAGLGTGDVDVVIGTHRLLSGDIAFSGLGLLVIDEEQRFGVTAKDRIKELRTDVDVLTLTATPIPRTLEMALSGIRPVSHIRTPPEDRHPILTYVGPYDSPTVSAAIRRELLREGQVFYVHNRVQSIDHATARLQALVPDARFAVAHGQLSEGQLEQVMLDFWAGAYDVLVATTIIESGLDLPAVNTLIVERSEMLGLAQLYQLRGRVGRSAQRAYAYLFHAPDHGLTDEAYRRLEAIGQATDLGSGFELAYRDLQIRGAGSILGEMQSGHVDAVGLDLYAELMAEAVAELEGRPPQPPPEPQVRIDLAVDAHLPEDYVGDQAARLEAYRRLAVAGTEEEVADVAAEWEDRYGPLPDEVRSLLEVARLRVDATRLGLSEIVGLRREIKLRPVHLSASGEVRLQRLAPRHVYRGSELFLPFPSGPVVAGLREVLRTLWPPSEE
jgi:transcription-repair coupling factor (superfamily II helicase)